LASPSFTILKGKVAMSRKILCFFLILFFIFSMHGGSFCTPSREQVYIIPVEGEIEPGWLLFLERSLDEAREAGAAAVILELDTPGGYIDTAIKARKLLESFPLSTYAYVQPRALSAGAYLALSVDAFFMAPGATIGAAEPRILGGQAVDEKILSTWEGEMKAAAERQGKDPLFAAAMVRKEIEIEGVVSSGELLTFTALEAESHSFSDGTATSLPELLSLINLSGAEIIRTTPSFWEILGGWLIKPTIATVILSLAFLFLVIEVLTAGFGVAGLLSILCFSLYFGGHLFTGISNWPAIFLFVFGIILLLVEAFIPGFGIFGIGGLISVFTSIVLAAASTVSGLRMLLISFFIAAFAGYLVFKYLQRKGMLRRFILIDAATAELGYSASADLQHLVGKKGRAVTILRPSGIVEVEGTKYDVVSEGIFIHAGVPIEVIKVEGRRVVVRKVERVDDGPVNRDLPTEEGTFNSEL
jgi:membrane-bound serine protease (ClpP class)